MSLFTKESLVHFDIKPENILVKLNKENNEITDLKIIDFGSSFVFGSFGNLPNCTPVI